MCFKLPSDELGPGIQFQVPRVQAMNEDGQQLRSNHVGAIINKCKQVGVKLLCT